jgi:hypothetical protein
VSNPGQRFLDAEVALERERVAREKKEAAQRLRARVAPILGVTGLPNPDVPPDVVPLHETPRPDGLVVDVSIGSYVRKRWSPLRKRWPEVHEYDQRVAQLEQRQADLNAELVGLQEQLVQVEAADREALARWVATQEGERPLPVGPGVEQRISEKTAERDALTTAMQHTLDDKAAYVEKHRSRLVREAAKARKHAVKRLHADITQVEQSRAEAVECVSAERWAAEYPGEAADAGTLGLQKIRGGRLVKAIPDFRGQLVAGQLTDALHQDADWLDSVLEKERETGEPDIREQAVWEQTPEGDKAINRERHRIREGLAARNVHAAGWGNE